MKKIKLTLVFILISTFLTNVSYSQSKMQETKLAIYNFSLGGMIGGIGAVINNKTEVGWYKVFLKGFIKGGIGGLVVYTGKSAASQINKKQNLFYGWPAKLIHTTGVSIIENAALNKSLMNSWSMHFGFLRLRIGTDSPKIDVKFLPFAFSGFVAASWVGDLKLKKSLLLGTPYFETDSLILNRLSAAAVGNNIVIHRNVAQYMRLGTNEYEITAHEYIHSFQFREYGAFNSFFTDANEKLKTKTLYKKLSKYIYLDLPYHWLFYSLQEIPHGRSCRYDNFYEIEAEFFARLKPVPSCH